MKKLINGPNNVLKDALSGMAAAHGDTLVVNFKPAYITRKDAPVSGKVAILSGGGSGHEPMHGGFVGYGMLDGACPGEIFTCPTPDQMMAAVKSIDGGAGVLFIVKNYSGDVMNFEMAQELCQTEGIEIESVLINDDVAVMDSLHTTGHRGTGVTVLAEKICGAAAEQGRNLAEVADICRKINQQGKTMGVALTSCTLPAAGKPTFDIGPDEMEFGVGIHGEPGRRRMPICSAAELVPKMTQPIIDDLKLQKGDELIAMVNGMGATPLMELYIIYNELDKICAEKGFVIIRNLVGNYMTSLDMAGCSITLLKIDPELTGLWDAPVNTPAMRWGV